MDGIECVGDGTTGVIGSHYKECGGDEGLCQECYQTLAESGRESKVFSEIAIMGLLLLSHHIDHIARVSWSHQRILNMMVEDDILFCSVYDDVEGIYISVLCRTFTRL